MGEGRGRVSAARQRRGNRACADCEQSSPQWASVNNGVFVCLDCSGVHRCVRLGRRGRERGERGKSVSREERAAAEPVPALARWAGIVRVCGPER
jgi:hypothetical protein